MPYFAYFCRACSTEFEFLELPQDEERPRCPECQGVDLQKLASAPPVARSKRGVSDSALRAAGQDFLNDPDSFASSMQALEDKTGAKLTESELDRAMDRLKCETD